ncbi:MAG: Lrp/AsnC family transcriptional regulator [Ferrovibrionaceae bacterium]
MAKSERKPLSLDATDHKILAALVEDGRMSTLDLADRVGLSPTPCSRRLRRLEESGVIEGYTARINHAALGLNICVMVTIRLARHGPETAGQFLQAIQGRPEITECLLVTGNIDYLLRVWVRDVEALRDFIKDALQSIPAVAETSTMVILDMTKSAGLLTASATPS